MKKCFKDNREEQTIALVFYASMDFTRDFVNLCVCCSWPADDTQV